MTQDFGQVQVIISCGICGDSVALDADRIVAKTQVELFNERHVHQDGRSLLTVTLPKQREQSADQPAQT